MMLEKTKSPSARWRRPVVKRGLPDSNNEVGAEILGENATQITSTTGRILALGHGNGLALVFKEPFGPILVTPPFVLA